MTIDFECENCKGKFSLDMSKTGKGKSIPCPHCKAKYVFEDNKMKDLDKQLENILKDIKIDIRF